MAFIRAGLSVSGGLIRPLTAPAQSTVTTQALLEWDDTNHAVKDATSATALSAVAGFSTNGGADEEDIVFIPFVAGATFESTYSTGTPHVGDTVEIVTATTIKKLVSGTPIGRVVAVYVENGVTIVKCIITVRSAVEDYTALDTRLDSLDTYGRLPDLNKYFDGVLFNQVAATTAINTTTTETTIVNATGALGTLTIPANYMKAGGKFKITARGTIANTSTPTIRFKVYADATAIGDTTAVAMSAITGTSVWELIVFITVRTIGATGTLSVEGVFRYYAAATGGAPIDIVIPHNAVSSFDTTDAKDIDVKMTWGTNSSSNTISPQQFTLEAAA